MAINRDWLPKGRAEALAMARAWTGVITANADAWTIPEKVPADLDSLVQVADAALADAQNEATRTPVATAKCKAAFDALTEKMRDTKRRYFLTPPLQDPDYIALGLKPRDSVQSPSGTPNAQASIENYLVGRHELGVKIIYITGNPNDTANKGCRIWYTIINQGETPPATPDDLRKSFYTKRKKDVIPFDYGDSGKIVYMAVQIENEGRKGPWGPLVSALIP